MPANPFELSAPTPAAMSPDRVAHAVAATLVLAGVLALGVDMLLQFLFLPNDVESPDAEEVLNWLLPRYDAYYLVSVAANRLHGVLMIGLSGWLIIQYLFERNGQTGYRRLQPLLLTLLLISLGFTFALSLLLQLAWTRGFAWMQELGLRHEALSIFGALLGTGGDILLWALSVPVAICLSLRFSRNDALAGSPRQVGRTEAAWLAAFCVGLGTLTLLQLPAKPFQFLGDVQTFACFYGIGAALTLAAFAGTRMALPERLSALRPQSLLAASLVTIASLTLSIGGAATLVLLSYGSSSSMTLLVALGLLGLLALPVCGVLQWLCVRLIYRPVAA